MLDDYKATKVLEENENSKHYLAVMKDMKNTEDCFLISKFHDRESINMFISDFICLSKDKISEFMECFSENSVFYVIFKYTKGVPLLKFLEKEKLAFDHRIAIAQSIFLKLRDLESLPNSIKKTVLMPHNIVIDEGNIYFNYQMDLCSLRLTSDINVFHESAGLIGELFTYNEIAKNGRLKVIFDKCRKDVYESFGELLKDFDSLAKENTETLNIKAVVEEKKKKLIHKTRDVLIAASLLIGIGLLFYEYVIKSRENVPVYAPVDEIGTLRIEEKDEDKGNDDDLEEDKKTIYVQRSIVDNNEIPVVEEPVVEKPVVENPTSVGDISDEDEPVEDVIEDVEVPDTPEYIEYVIKPGDNIHKICRAYYGDIRWVPIVIEYNKLTYPNLIHGGRTLKLPDRSLFNP